MPIYDYVCNTCTYLFESTNKINESQTDVCPKCGNSAYKIIMNVPLMRMSNYDLRGNWCGNSSKELAKDKKK